MNTRIAIRVFSGGVKQTEQSMVVDDATVSARAEARRGARGNGSCPRRLR